MSALVQSDTANGVVTLRLNRPARSNALTVEMLEALEAALHNLSDAPPLAVHLTGTGPHFSTGGDVAAFYAAVERGDGPKLATRVVGALHRVIVAMTLLPAPVITSLRGATTGGAAGLAFAADMVAMQDQAFLQPYYGVVGFAPDGGWTAMLPRLIGTGPAAAALMLNQRITAPQAMAMGLATGIAADPDSLVDVWVETMRGHQPGALSAAKALIWNPARLQELRDGLDAEQAAFVARIDAPETRAGMAAFLGERSVG